MDAFFKLIHQTNIEVVIAIWLMVIGLAVFIYSGVIEIKRRQKLKSIGLSHEKGDKRNEQFEELGKYVTNLVAASELDISDKFIAAGFYNTRFAHLLMPAKYLLLFIGLGLIGLWGLQTAVPVSTLLIYGVVWLIVAIILPDAYLASRTRTVQKKISNQLPYMLDLMGVCVQTGMTIEAAMSYLSQEMAGFDRDLAYILKRTNDRAQIVGLENALEELYLKIPTTEIRSFVMTLNQSLQYGSSIYTVLTTLAVDIREVQMLGLEEKIGKLSAKMSVPLILFIMFPIVILIAAPGVMRMMG